MKTISLGNSDMKITRIGLGAWAMGGGNWQFGWGPQDDKESIAAIHRALELGINWIDTAAVYGLGHSEKVVARALTEWKDCRPYLFTKCGTIWNKDREIEYSLEASSIRKEIEASLQRLRVDTIDLYQIHWPADDLATTEEGWSELARLQQEGKVRWIGVCNFSVQELEKASHIAPITSLQPPYSLIRRDIETEILPYCLRKNIGVVAYSPMASGLLSGTMTRERIDALPPEDWRAHHPEFQEPKLGKNLAFAEKLAAIGTSKGRSAGEVAIAWALHQPGITGSIVGARNPLQVEGFITAAELELSNKDLAELSRDSG